MKIKVFAEKCTGCGLCENICSLSHINVVDKNCSAIRVTLDDLGESVHRPFVCKQCKVMKCLEDDIKKDPAIDVEAERKKFVWTDEKRAENCPFNGCFVYKKQVYHCNLCDGDPQCVKVCTQGALKIEE